MDHEEKKRDTTNKEILQYWKQYGVPPLGYVVSPGELNNNIWKLPQMISYFLFFKLCKILRFPHMRAGDKVAPINILPGTKISPKHNNNVGNRFYFFL